MWITAAISVAVVRRPVRTAGQLPCPAVSRYWDGAAIDPAIVQLGAAGVLAVVVGLFVTGKIGPMSLVDRADARADRAIAALAEIARDVTELTVAVKELTAVTRAQRER